MTPEPIQLAPVGDPAHDVFRVDNHPLDVFFRPRNVAVIGATETAGTVGRTLLWNLISTSFGGAVYPVNPKRTSVLGIRAYPRVSDLPEPVDLAVIATPAPSVPGVVAECVARGARGAVILSAGFKEHGEEGARLESEIERIAEGKIRLIGPNCLGLMSPHTGVNATFARGMSLAGNVAFLSQSGALCTAVLDWSLHEKIGFSAFVSLGSMLDVGWGDLIDYLGNDPKTESIVIYMESVGDAQAFLSAAREVSMTKPVIVIKAGRTEAAAKAAVSHTGALVGRDDVLDAAFERCGVVRVDSIADLFLMAGVLAKQPRPKGPRLTIVTNAGGPGVLAADALIAHGGALADISPETLTKLNTFLPAPWSHGNPIDVLGDAGADRYAKVLEDAVKDPASDGLLMILTPQAMTDSTGTAEALAARAAEAQGKPILASWMGGESVEPGRTILNEAGIPVFAYPDTAARLFSTMWTYSAHLQSLYETPTLSAGGEDGEENLVLAEKALAGARAEGRKLLTEYESKALLAAYDIPTVETRLAADEDEAVRAAEGLGFPVVLKLHSTTITHKSDVGGVRLNITDADTVRRAYRAIQTSVTEKKGPSHFQGVTVQPMARHGGYEVILGSSPDPQFGPVLLFGTGGRLVEIYQDRALALPPLTSTLARSLMRKTKIYQALHGVRGQAPCDVAALERLLVRFSRLVVEQSAVKEIEINPLLVSPQGLLALDARVVLYGAGETPARPAIRPYPSRYVWPTQAKDGTSVVIRPVRPEDEPLFVKFHERLSERTVTRRFLEPMGLGRRTAHERLRRICFTDYDREMVLVAEHTDAQGGEEIMGVGRLSRSRGRPHQAVFSLLVADAFQRRGLGLELLRRLIEIARLEGLKHVVADIAADNAEVRKVAERLGFRFTPRPDGAFFLAELDIA
jgi:acetyltransferase